MSAQDSVPPFLAIAFDWFILEHWEGDKTNRSPELLRRLGADWAALGFRGRQSYARKASTVSILERNPFTLRRPIDTVPTDLLSPMERLICDNESTRKTFLLRVDYGPGTDARFKEIIDVMKQGSDGLLDYHNVIEDARYASLNDNLVPDIYARYPILLEPSTMFYAYPEEDGYDFDCKEVQNMLYMADFPDLDEDYRKVCGRIGLIAADHEAMKTGLLLWLMIDEFGKEVIKMRVAPEALQTLVTLHSEIIWEEWRSQVASWERYFQTHSYSLSPWTPPQT